MILSVSRRTDIPAFYSDWFYNRIQEGFVLVRNPMNTNQISKIDLSPDLIDCIVFWTKNPKPMMERLNELDRYNYYFQFTLTAYDITLEANLGKKEDLIDTFIDLSKTIGKEKLIWRYDPIILSEKFDKDFHYKSFEYLASNLKDYTNKCVISFLDLYKNTEFNLKSINLQPIKIIDMQEIAGRLSNIASKYGLLIETCSEDIDLDYLGVEHGKCIDDSLMEKIAGNRIKVDKDPNQRLNCSCRRSIDIGAYNTCKNGCLYCYANFNQKIVYSNSKLHNKNSPLLFGQVNKEDIVYERKMKSYIDNQLSFL